MAFEAAVTYHGCHGRATGVPRGRFFWQPATGTVLLAGFSRLKHARHWHDLPKEPSPWQTHGRSVAVLQILLRLVQEYVGYAF